MRVIAGIAKNRKLDTIEGNDTRPTTDKVKEAIFSSIHFYLPGKKVLDLFAGSGQLGIEALSRGAAHATFIEQNLPAFNMVIKNLKSVGLFSQAKVIRMDSFSFLERLDEDYDFVFVDPPYACESYEDILTKLGPHILENGRVVVEHKKEAPIPESAGGLMALKTVKYGKIFVTYFVREEDQ